MPLQLDEMPQHDNDLGPFSHHPELDALAYRFFKQFSRMEYALKATGKLKQEDGPAEANWTMFGDEIDQQFLTSKDNVEVVRSAFAYIMDNPPKRQMARAGALEWQDTMPHAETKTSLLLLYVCRVRNNLFHGGKMSHDGWADTPRSEQLLRYGLAVLDHCIDLSPRVRQAYQL